MNFHEILSWKRAFSLSISCFFKKTLLFLIEFLYLSQKKNEKTPKIQKTRFLKIIDLMKTLLQSPELDIYKKSLKIFDFTQ